MTTIVIAKASGIVRKGIRAIVESEHGISVVGEAADGLTAVELVEQHRPTILMAGLMLPRLNGLEVTREVKRIYAETSVIIISPYLNAHEMAEALRSGAKGCLHLDSSIEDVLAAVRETSAGRRYMGSAETQTMLTALSGKSKNGNTLDPYDSLTSREREILQLTAEGLKSSEIAQRLFISERTVETHRSHLMQKLKLHSQSDILRFAIRRGLVSA